MAITQQLQKALPFELNRKEHQKAKQTSAGDYLRKKLFITRVPAIYGDQPSHGTKASQFLPFQSGSVDIITFKGPKLQTIKEIWIGLESGSWRLDGLSLKVIHGARDTPEDLKGTLELKFSGLQYTFDKLSALLGEEGASVVEARPIAVTDLSGISISDLQEGQLSSARTASSIKELKEDGLREYADLKQSLLLYDISIVITGFSAFTLASNDGAAYSFLVGGIGGFLYLLLLQRSVDGLPAISSTSEGSWRTRLLFFWQHSNPCKVIWRVTMDPWTDLPDNIALNILPCFLEGCKM